MNYVWEVLLAARESDTEDTALHFYPEREPSPYMEASFAEMNLTAPEDDKVGVNPLYRFSDVFPGCLCRTSRIMRRHGAFFWMCSCTAWHAQTCVQACIDRNIISGSCGRICWETYLANRPQRHFRYLA